MRKIIIALSLLAMAIVAGCDDVPKKTMEDIFKGEHQLKCSVCAADTTGCEYMLPADSTGKLRYVWQAYDSSYITSTIPSNRVRVRIDESVNNMPYIKYRWGGGGTAHPVMQDNIDLNVVYVLLVCSESDCPPALKTKAHKDK